MKYALLIYGDEKAWAEASEEERRATYTEHREFIALLESRGAVRGGEELDQSASAAVVRKRAGDVMVTRGPFAETAEHLAGFYIVEAADLDEAIELATALPSATVEVRPTVAPPEE